MHLGCATPTPTALASLPGRSWLTGTLGSGSAYVASGATLNDQVLNISNSGAGSLNQAILNADTVSGPGNNLITFNIPGSGVQVISPTTALPLPALTVPVTLDATTESGYSGTPLIELNGASAVPGTVGLTVTGGSTTVKGLDIVQFSGDGIDLTTNGGDIIQANYIGINPAGNAALANGGNGISINGISGNTIGGTTTAARNIVSGNGASGVYVTAGAGNVIEENYIGTTAAGNATLGNSSYGVFLSNASVNSVLNNTISGNGSDGVNVTGYNPGLVSEYLADSTANDALGTNNGTFQGPSYTAGLDGQAFQFNGTNGVVAGSTGLPTGSADRTLQAWVYLTAIPPSGPSAFIAGYGAFGVSGAFYGLALTTQSPNGTPGAYFALNSGTIVSYFYGSGTYGTVPLNQWDLLSLTTNSGGTSMYINGSLLGTLSLSGTPVTTATSSNFLMGSATVIATGATRVFNGLVDDITVYNRALSSGEIAATYQTGGATLIQGNNIGVNAAGNAVLANAGNAVTLNGSSDNIVGATATGNGNLIGNSSGAGVVVTGSTSASNFLQNNTYLSNASFAVQVNSGARLSSAAASRATSTITAPWIWVGSMPQSALLAAPAPSLTAAARRR